LSAWYGLWSPFTTIGLKLVTAPGAGVSAALVDFAAALAGLAAGVFLGVLETGFAVLSVARLLPTIMIAFTNAMIEREPYRIAFGFQEQKEEPENFIMTCP
jgi:hypothetical protein